MSNNLFIIDFLGNHLVAQFNFSKASLLNLANRNYLPQLGSQKVSDQKGPN